MASAVAAVAVAVSVHGLSCHPLFTFGTDEQKRRFLRPLWTGEEIWCQLFSEPGAGSDLASLSTRAELDGDEYVVNGQKTFISNGMNADFILVVAKTDRAHQALAAQFADHGRTGPLERAYLAFVWGSPLQPKGTVDAPLGRHPKSRDKIAVRSDGRPSITHWQVLERFPGKDGKPAVSLIECRLETGRTHQIRVHMSATGHPCVGDPMYGSDPNLAKRLGLQRQWLHAVKLGFTHPGTGKWFEIVAPYPADLEHALEVLRG